MGTSSFEEFMTTSDAARHCGVTRFTIRNWIVEKKLKASKTAGRHHRILRSDLLQFMKEAGIRPARDEKKSPVPVFCWEFSRLTNARSHKCTNCLVFKERANRCFLTVHEFGRDQVQCGQDCSKCEYMELYFPKEKAALALMLARTFSKTRGLKSSTGKTLSKNFYKSGRYFAAFKNIFSKTK